MIIVQNLRQLQKNCLTFGITEYALRRKISESSIAFFLQSYFEFENGTHPLNFITLLVGSAGKYIKE